MINIRLLITLSAAAIAAVCLAYGIGRYQGSAAERQARESERKAQEAQNAIITDYEHQIADYKRSIDSYVDADRLSDSRKCPAVPAASGAQPGLVCYTRADIQRKVAESLAVGAECDQLAIRYKALVKAYQSAYGAKEE